MTESFLDDILSGHLVLHAQQLISDVTPNRVIVLYFRPTVRRRREEGGRRERAIVSCGGLLGMVNERLKYDVDEAMTERQTDKVWRDVHRQIIET